MLTQQNAKTAPIANYGHFVCELEKKLPYYLNNNTRLEKLFEKLKQYDAELNPLLLSNKVTRLDYVITKLVNTIFGLDLKNFVYENIKTTTALAGPVIEQIIAVTTRLLVVLHMPNLWQHVSKNQELVPVVLNDTDTSYFCSVRAAISLNY